MKPFTTWEEAAAYWLDQIADEWVRNAPHDDPLGGLSCVIAAVTAVAPVESDLRYIGRVAMQEAFLLIDPFTSNRMTDYEKKMVELLAAKQHSYGHGNIEAFGTHGVVVRMSDKLARLKNLLKREERSERPKIAESIQDSWDDLVGYAAIGLMLLDGTFSLDLEADQSHPDEVMSAPMASDWGEQHPLKAGAPAICFPLKRLVCENGDMWVWRDDKWKFLGKEMSYQ